MSTDTPRPGKSTTPAATPAPTWAAAESTIMPTPSIVTDVGTTSPSAAVLAEQAITAAQRFYAADTLAHFGSQAQVNHWVRPSGFEDWAFVRLLPKNHPNDRQRAVHERLEYDLKQGGYIDAPPGTKFIGYEQDGDHKRWLCAPPQVAAMREAWKRAMQKSKLTGKPIDNFKGELDAMNLRVTHKVEKGNKVLDLRGGR